MMLDLNGASMMLDLNGASLSQPCRLQEDYSLRPINSIWANQLGIIADFANAKLALNGNFFSDIARAIVQKIPNKRSQIFYDLKASELMYKEDNHLNKYHPKK